MRLRVAVIGGGAAGLCALRHLSARPDRFEPVGMEQQAGVGGTWRYTDLVGTYPDGTPVQSSMYKNLRTNLPKEVMAFPGFPFPEELPSFMHHTDVQNYLERYCSHYGLERYLLFNTKVQQVTPLRRDSKTEWNVTYCTNGKQHCEIFDAVMVCNGHYEVPLIPNIEGQDVFQGQIIHSHDYRSPEAFSGKRVACLGAAPSGQDISLEIATCAQQVILSHNKPRLPTVLPENVNQKTGIKQLTHNTVVFNNGDEEPVDVIMLCTGYRYSFPFLSAECAVTIEEERVTPLYKHIIHSRLQTLSFIGICKIICPFPLFDNQVRFVLATLDGSCPLPPAADMEADIERDFRQRLAEGLPARHAHTMGSRQWAYNDMLASMGNFQSIPRAIQNLYDEVHRIRVLDLPNYKNRRYKITGEEGFQEL
ncbi:dimethylaniline monooxygenase [N-oxide-forming] 1-like [Dreissena polymorpha]|uniref:Flavin-containing monooxygenase n=1 Tax=Dreissena polymorpha TaxID=45954 RepID=A0A9D4E5W8_DREPO|nr:dimethylaniline monooxygenase [N-oxide-forming] 1-like [Dreissena polymorpha]KAH3772799.1 hypothetical protein DPMN_174146 [Dreissena polymorpha]